MKSCPIQRRMSTTLENIRLHCSIQRILTECQVCSSRSSGAEDTAPVELTCRKGGVTVSSEVRGKYHKCDKSYEE